VDQIDSISDFVGIVETAAVQIGNVRNPKSVECIGQIRIRNYLADDFKIILAFGDAVQHRQKRHSCQTNRYRTDKFPSFRKKCRPRWIAHELTNKSIK